MAVVLLGPGVTNLAGSLPEGFIILCRDPRGDWPCCWSIWACSPSPLGASCYSSCRTQLRFQLQEVSDLLRTCSVILPHTPTHLGTRVPRVPSPVLGAENSSVSRADTQSVLEGVSLFWPGHLACVPLSFPAQGCDQVARDSLMAGRGPCPFLVTRPIRTLNSNLAPTLHTSEKPAAADVNQRAPKCLASPQCGPWETQR